MENEPQRRPEEESLSSTNNEGVSAENKEGAEREQLIRTNEATPEAGTGTEKGRVSEEKGGSKKPLIATLIVLILILAGVWAYQNYFRTTAGTNATDGLAGGDTTQNFEEVFNVNEVDPVANVNGTALSADDYARSINEVAQNAQSSGANLADSNVQQEIKGQAIRALVNTELLYQAAQNAGFSASTEDIQNEYTALETQFGGEEQLASALQSFNLTVDELRESMGKQIIISDYIQSEIDASDVVVTDAEIEEMYNSFAAQGGDGLPPLEEVRDALRSQLEAQKQQEMVGSLIAKLREVAKIELFI